MERNYDAFTRDFGTDDSDVDSDEGDESGDGSDGGSDGDGGCFVTTACIRAIGAPDDCFELQMMRRLRSYLMSFQEGRDEVHRYYEKAPHLIALVEASEQRDHLWLLVYTNLKSIAAKIAADDYDEAHREYEAMVTALERSFRCVKAS